MTAQLTPRVTEAFATGVIAYLKQENKVSERPSYQKKKRTTTTWGPGKPNRQPNERQPASPAHAQSRKLKKHCTTTYPPATAKCLIDVSLVNPNNNDKHPKFSRLSMEDQGGFRNLKLPFSNAEDSIGEVRESVGVGGAEFPHIPATVTGPAL